MTKAVKVTKPKKAVIDESLVIKVFKRKTTEALAKIESPDSFRQTDRGVKFVFEVADAMLGNEGLDQLPMDWLMRHGGRLVGAYAYLSVQSSRARLERDVYEQKLEEMVNEYTLQYYADDEKITHAKAKAKNATDEISELIAEKNYMKNNFEAVTEACDKMASMVQSIMKIKLSEERQANYKGNN